MSKRRKVNSLLRSHFGIKREEYMGNKILIGKGNAPVYLDTAMLNRHGIIAGATGTGKTVTLKVLAENFSKQGISVFLSDIKGDLASIAEPGVTNEAIGERVQTIGLDEYENRSFPVEFYDIFGTNGIALRATISEMGPILLSKLLGLNDTQEGVLNIAFSVADESGLLLIDIKDLRAMLNYVNENSKDLSRHYGNISPASVGAILRSLLVLEEQGGNAFLGEPEFDILDFIRTDYNGEGVVNVLASDKLFLQPKLYSIFLLWLLTELYETLPEVGDLDKPKIVFFFDEAHLLFKDLSPTLQDKIEQVVRLVRSKGVGVFFITQIPTDIPDAVLSQCGNKVQHALRAFTPKEQKAIEKVAETFRQDGSIDVEEAITTLKVGEALITVLDEKGMPTFVDRAIIAPPESKMGTVDPSLRLQRINASPMYVKYGEAVDPESAYELIEKQKVEQARLAQEQAEELQRQKELAIQQKEEEKQLALQKKEEERQLALQQKEAERLRIAEEKRLLAEQKARERAAAKPSGVEKFAGSVVGSIGRELGRQITRGIFGVFKK